MLNGAKHNMFNTYTKCSFFAAGYCTHSEKVTIRGGKNRTIRFPALFALIEHPRLGPILFDTGYTERFFEQTAAFPYSLYRRTTPVFYRPQDSAIEQLRQRGIEPEEIQYVILSHFHADHIGGVRDFPNAAFIYLQAAYDAVRHRRGWSAVKAGYLPGLLPDDFERRSLPIDETRLTRLPADFPFERGIDIFEDGSVIAVDVPGHAEGQIGIMLSTAEQLYFLCADAVWSSRAYREMRRPHWIAGIIMANREQYMDSFRRVHQMYKLYPDFCIVPTHCSEMWETLVQGGGPK